MTMISAYYARVGVDVDNASLGRVDNYLGQVERKVLRLQKSIEQATSFNLRFKIDREKALRGFKATSNWLAKHKDLTFDFNKVNFKTQSLVDKINRGFKDASKKGTGVKLDAILSQRSLIAIRRQIANYLKTVTFSPKITAQISHNVSNRVARDIARQSYATIQREQRAGASSSQTSSTTTRQQSSRKYDSVKRTNPMSERTMSPYYNPMMVGGSIGAMVRYGAYAFPLYGGVWGFNAIANKAATLQSQSLALKVGVGTADGQAARTAKEYEDYLNDLSLRLGITTQQMTPHFAQMLSGAIGTPLEEHLTEGFAKLMEFGSVMGIDDQAMSLTIKAFSQMILKKDRL